MYDIVIVSDIHLGSSVSRAKNLLETLRLHPCAKLILNGDIFDDLDFTRLNHEHWELLSYFREMTNPKYQCEVVWIAGNHDGAANILSRLVGVPVREEYLFEWGGRRCLAIHGHQFDRFLMRNVIVSTIASNLYLFIQKIDTERQFISRFLKRASKSWLRVSEKVMKGAVRHGKLKGVSVVFCGHTHRDIQEKVGEIEYYNSGCWTDIPSALITLDSAGIQIRKFE